MNIDQLILYRGFEHEALLRRLCEIFRGEKEGRIGSLPEDFAKAAHALVDLAGAYGFEGNLWHCFLALCLANNENVYSQSCEIVGRVEGSLNTLMLHDCRILKQLFDLTPALVDEAPEAAGVLADYHPPRVNSRIYNQRVRDRIVELSVSLEQADSPETFKQILSDFYGEFGVGRFGLHKAFDVKENADGSAVITPITRVEHIRFSDIVSYEEQKRQLRENTEAFLRGIPANNVLLFGDAGTGKSSCVKALVNEYYDQGLRMIEVYKHQARLLPEILEQVKDRNYRFIIYMDDLSFEDSELEYKYLKAILEGGLGRRPDNVLIYATSNRRHLIKESFKDRDDVDEELHRRDTMQEKLSLSARFGVTIFFGSPDRRLFRRIVKALAERSGVRMDEERLMQEANIWEIAHGGLSGRTASQFIIHLKALEAGEADKEA